MKDSVVDVVDQAGDIVDAIAKGKPRRGRKKAHLKRRKKRTKKD